MLLEMQDVAVQRARTALSASPVFALRELDVDMAGERLIISGRSIASITSNWPKRSSATRWKAFGSSTRFRWTTSGIEPVRSMSRPLSDEFPAQEHTPPVSPRPGRRERPAGARRCG